METILWANVELERSLLFLTLLDTQVPHYAVSLETCQQWAEPHRTLTTTELTKTLNFSRFSLRSWGLRSPWRHTHENGFPLPRPRCTEKFTQHKHNGMNIRSLIEQVENYTHCILPNLTYVSWLCSLLVGCPIRRLPSLSLFYTSVYSKYHILFPR